MQNNCLAGLIKKAAEIQYGVVEVTVATFLSIEDLPVGSIFFQSGWAGFVLDCNSVADNQSRTTFWYSCRCLWFQNDSRYPEDVIREVFNAALAIDKNPAPGRTILIPAYDCCCQ